MKILEKKVDWLVRSIWFCLRASNGELEPLDEKKEGDKLIQEGRELLTFPDAEGDKKHDLFPCGNCGFGLDLGYLQPGGYCPNCQCAL